MRRRWKPGDPIYPQPAIGFPIYTLRDYAVDDFDVDAATWPDPDPTDDLDQQ